MRLARASSPRTALSPLDAREAQRTWLAKAAQVFEHENYTPAKDQCSSRSVALVEPLLQDVDVATTTHAIVSLGKALDAASEEEAALICAAIRECGAIQRLVDLLDHSEAVVHRMATMVIANVAALEVDPLGAAMSKLMILEAGGFSKVVGKIFAAQEGTTIMYSLGAVQNLCCADLRCVETLQRTGADVRLLELSSSPDARIAR